MNYNKNISSKKGVRFLWKKQLFILQKKLVQKV